MATTASKHIVTVPSSAPFRHWLMIPVLEAKSEHFIDIQLSKLPSNITVLRPYFEAYVAPSSASLVAADAWTKSQRKPSNPTAAASSFVPDKLKEEASLNLYCNATPVDTDRNALSRFEWHEGVEQSCSARRLRDAQRFCDAQRRDSKASFTSEVTTAKLAIGKPFDPNHSDDEDESAKAQRDEAQADGSAAAAKTSPFRQRPNDDDVVFAISDVCNSFHLAIFSPTALCNVVVPLVVNCPIAPRDDFRHPLRMCRMRCVNGMTYDMAVEWLSKHRVKMMQGLISLTVDGCDTTPRCFQSRGGPDQRQTFLHVICQNLGDPRFARMLLKHCSRFVRKDEKELATQRTALHMIFSSPDGNPPILTPPGLALEPLDWYARVLDCGTSAHATGLELTRLLLEEANASPHEEDVFGNTVVHYAACGHRLGSSILPLLLTMGAPAKSKNLAGRTPAEEVRLRQHYHGLMTWDVSEALDILERYDPEPKAGGNANQHEGDEPLDGESVSAARRSAAAHLIGHGIDLPRTPIRFLDTLPPAILKSTSSVDPSKPVFATPVVAVDETGYPRSNGEPQWRPPHLLSDTPSVDAKQKPVIDPSALVKLQTEFASFDVNDEGFVNISEMRKVYLSFDGYGVSESTSEIDKMLSVMGIKQDGRVSFEDYCIVMLRMNRL